MPSENNELQHPARAAFFYFQLANSLIPRPVRTKEEEGVKGEEGMERQGGPKGEEKHRLLLYKKRKNAYRK